MRLARWRDAHNPIEYHFLPTKTQQYTKKCRLVLFFCQPGARGDDEARQPQY